MILESSKWSEETLDGFQFFLSDLRVLSVASSMLICDSSKFV